MANPSATSGEETCHWGFFRRISNLEVVTVHPSPAFLSSFLQTASEHTIVDIGGGSVVTCAGGKGLAASLIWSCSHSLAALIATASVSSNEFETPLKTNLFLSFHSVQITHGNSWVSTIPIRGRQGVTDSPVQLLSKSTIPLESKFFVNEASLHTCWAKEHWKSRWIIDSDSPYRLHQGSTSIWRSTSLSPTGTALFSAFQANIFIFGVWDSIRFCTRVLPMLLV